MPQPPPVWAAPAVALLISLGSCGDAQEAEAQALDPAAEGIYEEALTLLNAGRAPEAEERLVSAIELGLDHAFVHYHLGVARYEQSVVQLGGTNIDQGKLASSLASLEQALARDPDVASIHLYRGLALILAHDWEAAAGSFVTALERDPKLVRARVQLGRAYAHLEQLEQAIVELQRSTREAPRNASAQHQLGLAALEAERWDVAEGAFRRATELGPGQPDPWYAWSTALRRLGRSADADRTLAEYHARIKASRAGVGVPDERRQQALEHFREGLVHMRAGRRVDARAAFEAVLAIQPKSGGAMVNLGLLSLNEGDRGSARGRFEEAVRVQPQNESARFYLGSLLAEAGEIQQAAKHLRAALEANPDHSQARDLLAQLGDG